MKHTALIVGDVVALAVVTFIGFANHGEFSTSFVPRMAASLVPLCIGWFLLAPQLGLFQGPITGATAELWRPAFVMLFAGPLAALLRSIILGATVMPSFAVVLSLTAAAALTIWRIAYAVFGRRVASQA
jgi:hypothetical protein